MYIYTYIHTSAYTALIERPQGSHNFAVAGLRITKRPYNCHSCTTVDDRNPALPIMRNTP